MILPEILKNMSAREKILCASALVSVSIFLVWNVALPSYNSYRQKRATLSALEIKYEKLKSLITHHPLATSDMKSSQNNETQTQNPADMKMDKESQITAVMDIVRRICAVSHVKLMGVSIDTTQRAHGSVIKIMLETDYRATAKLITRLSALRPPVHISALRMSSDPLSEKRDLAVALTLETMNAV